jgi:hypothetical protein
MGQFFRHSLPPLTLNIGDIEMGLAYSKAFGVDLKRPIDVSLKDGESVKRVDPDIAKEIEKQFKDDLKDEGVEVMDDMVAECISQLDHENLKMFEKATGKPKLGEINYLIRKLYKIPNKCTPEQRDRVWDLLQAEI